MHVFMKYSNHHEQLQGLLQFSKEMYNSCATHIELCFHYTRSNSLASPSLTSLCNLYLSMFTISQSWWPLIWCSLSSNFIWNLTEQRTTTFTHSNDQRLLRNSQVLWMCHATIYNSQSSLHVAILLTKKFKEFKQITVTKQKKSSE